MPGPGRQRVLSMLTLWTWYAYVDIGQSQPTISLETFNAHRLGKEASARSDKPN
jgi:hypothetical protein